MGVGRDEYADFLFAHRARRVAKHYINTAIIPDALPQGRRPNADVRGNITSHRARRSPPAPPPAANPGSTTTLAAAGAPTPSSSRASTAWPANAATSTPKESSKGQLLEAKDNLQQDAGRYPTTDDERAAVDDGRSALDELLERLADVPAPAGPTPSQIGAPAAATLLPVIDLTPARDHAD
ncbi:hypothetical protein [Streptomyces sp. NK08204]|uniref:hypothetical protein n=1 Tax=Streptomyces sp. NK08204 TaxID=2873260 RepID=UPI001CEDCA89|nr:hypothetical protein [Streptomyces sp. NK08204]